MQTLDVQMQNPAPNSGLKSVMAGKTGAETARNGSSFLAMIEKMIAGTMEGAVDMKAMSAAKTAGRGAGDAKMVPGEEDTLIKSGSGKKDPLASMKKNVKTAVKNGIAEKGEPVQAKSDPVIPTAKRGERNVAAEKNRASLEAAEKTGSEAKEAAKKLADESFDAQADSGSADASILALLRKDSVSIPAENTVINTIPGKGEAGKAGEKIDGDKSTAPITRSERKDRKAFINVRDERTSDPIQGESPLMKTTEIHDDNTADMTIGFRTAENGRSTAGENRILAEKRDGEGQNFASMLSQELKNNAGDFVKTGQIVLRENNAGLIRLTLHPESLGNVKISLELSGDRKISGKIVVSSQEAYDAFNENLDGLSDAFVEGGFESAGFDLSWSGSGDEASGQGREAQTAAISPFYASSIPDVMSVPETADTFKSGSRQSAFSAINVFA